MREGGCSYVTCICRLEFKFKPFCTLEQVTATSILENIEDDNCSSTVQVLVGCVLFLLFCPVLGATVLILFLMSTGRVELAIAFFAIYVFWFFCALCALCAS